MAKVIRLALLGDPVAHSRSPAIHTAALENAGLEGEYVAVRAGVPQLELAVSELRSGLLDGFNVTMPLKQAAFSLSECLSREAGESGSVNSLRLRDDRVEGHSTDVVAFRDLFASDRFSDLRQILLLGSGGSARAALAADANRPITVSARSRPTAEALTTGETIDWGVPIRGALVVNATPLGMRGEPLPTNVIEAAGGLIDLPYGANRTPAVISADSNGLPWVDGVEFLARQARASFHWWTGVRVELDVLVDAARNV